MAFIKTSDVHHYVLEMLGSEEYKHILSTTDDHGDGRAFRAGATFGAAIAAIYVSTHAENFEPAILCRCKDCAYRKSGHPQRKKFPCSKMEDTDFCSYGIPSHLLDNKEIKNFIEGQDDETIRSSKRDE